MQEEQTLGMKIPGALFPPPQSPTWVLGLDPQVSSEELGSKVK